MSTATAVVTLTTFNPSVAIGSSYDFRLQILEGTLAVSNANYLTNGLPITFAKNEAIKSLASVPQFGTITGLAGYEYRYDSVHGTLRIYQAPASGPNPLVELGNGTAIPAAVQSDTISCRFEFPRN